MSDVRKIKSGLVKFPFDQFIGEAGNIFFDPDTGSMFLSDGVTPGGIPLGTGGGGGGGDVSKFGTPLNDQLAVWRNSTTIEGDSKLTWNGTTFAITGNLTVTGTVDGRDLSADGSKLDSIQAGATDDQTGAEITSSLDAYLGSTDWRSASGLAPGDNISSLTNDAGYITLTSLSASGDLSYNSLTGQFSVTTYKSANFDADFAAKTTDALAEGTVNLYFTDGRVAAVVNNTSIAALLDVDDDLVVNLQEDSILIYNATSNIFVAESFLSVLDRLKAELEVQYDRLVDEVGLITYIGEAEPGSSRSAAVWRIKRVEELADSNAGDVEILWANGNAAFDKVWNDRSTYIY